MAPSRLNDIKTLTRRTAILTALAIAIVLAGRCLKDRKIEKNFRLEDSPLHVEQIRDILELNTISFRNEVVADSVEYYRSTGEQISGNLQKLFDYNQVKHGLAHSHIKRRLTLIVKGELLYGVNLKTEDFTVVPNEKQLVVTIPAPQLLSVSINPSDTEIFSENGTWKDHERRALQAKARHKMISDGEKLQLAEKSKKPLERLLKQLVRTDKQLVIVYI